MKAARWAFVALSLALVIGITLWESRERLSPGPLHPAHAARPELAGPEGCPQCHGRGSSVDAEACTRCHEGIAAQQDRQRGLHGGEVPRIAECGRCHREHHGSELALLDQRSFERAGITAPDRYDHRFVQGFALAGRHAALRCEQCHRQALAAAPPPGGRYLGLSQACTACHEDVHQAEYGSDCARCHGQEQPFDRAPGFAHTDAFSLSQAHAGHRCSDCHAPGTDRSVAVLQQKPLPARSCGDCHASPHGAVPAGSPRTAMPLRDGADCARCHAATTFRDHGVTHTAHARFGYAIGGVHATLRCDQCHGRPANGYAARWKVRSPQPAQCTACHASPHGQPFTAAVQKPGATPNDCAGCHTEAHASFADGAITAAQHAAAGFPLAPPHDKLECNQCHGLPGDSYVARFPGRDAANCRACHRDPHGAQFDRNPDLRKCTACHLPVQWTPPTFDVAAHGRCRFPLLGQHEAVACRSCHKQVVRGVRTFTGTPQRCEQCHPDPHLGRFDGGGVPKQVDGREGCARCHDERQFVPVRNSFDHDLWTGFELAQSHAAVACSKCHGRSAAAGGHTTLGKAPGRLCSDCHQDVHQGQFRTGGKVDCQRCHDASKFTTTKFDHDRDSRFKLDATHKAVPCARCHLSFASPTGPVTRYRPLGTECKDCHLPGKKGSPR